MRAATLTPVTGSNLADRFHMPSGSTHDRARVLRRWRSRRSRPSSCWSRLVSRSNRRANSSTVPALATSASASARSMNSTRLAPSSFLEARVTASTWSPVIAPSFSASASFGVDSSVVERSVDFAACPNDCFAASATVFSTNESTARNWLTSPACWASNQARTSRTATRPEVIRSRPATGDERTAEMSSTRSTTPAISIPTTLNRGCHTVAERRSSPSRIRSRPKSNSSEKS